LKPKLVGGITDRLCGVLCGRSLAMVWSPVQVVLPLVLENLYSREYKIIIIIIIIIIWVM